MNNKTFLVILILIIIIAGIYFLLRAPKAQAPADLVSPKAGSVLPTAEDLSKTPAAPTATLADETANKSREGSQSIVVTYTDEGYFPNTLNVRAGATVIWANDSSLNMWIASAMHPSHMVYGGTSLSNHCPNPAGTSFDACKGTPPGNTWSFTFSKKGSWGYHNHLQAGHFGKIVVE